MKRTFKIIALCLALAAFAAFFAGCDMIDEMRAQHALLSEDKETIRYNGNTYKKLPDGAEIYCGSSYGDIYGNIAVTDEDVPVLLSNAMCHSSDYDIGNDIFSLYFMHYAVGENLFNGSYALDYDDVSYYCNEKDYDKYVEAIENNAMEFIGIEYQVNEEYDWYYTLEALSEETSKEILTHIQNPEKMSEDTYSDIYYGSEYHDSVQGYLYKCDSEGIVAQCLDNYSIARDEQGNVYLADNVTEKAVKLSDKASEECDNDKYFFGEGYYYLYDTWSEEYVDVIGGADEDTDIVVGEANLFKVDF